MEKGSSDHDKPFGTKVRRFWPGMESFHKWVKLEEKVRKGELEP